MYKINRELLGYEMHAISVVQHQRNLSDGKFSMEKQVCFEAVYDKVKHSYL